MSGMHSVSDTVSLLTMAGSQLCLSHTEGRKAILASPTLVIHNSRRAEAREEGVSLASLANRRCIIQHFSTWCFWLSR